MKSWSRRHLTDAAAFNRFIASDDRDRIQLPELLADLAEVDARKLYVPQGYSSMREYCVRVRGWSHDVARKRIRAARKGRQFPEILDALRDGRVHLTAVAMLAKHLERENVSELIAAATHKTMAEVALLIAIRFPGPAITTVFRPIGCDRGAAQPLTPAVPVGRSLVPEMVALHELRCMLPSPADELIRRAQDLRGGSTDPAGIPDLLVAALEHYVAHLEKQKFAATPKPRTGQPRPGQDPRHIPGAVKREVRRRDDGRCAFVSETGHRCESRAVQFDHILEVARGGTSTVANVRLLCHAHNQIEAERAFGAGFMEIKRRASVEARAERMRARAAVCASEAVAKVGAAVAAAGQVHD